MPDKRRELTRDEQAAAEILSDLWNKKQRDLAAEKGKKPSQADASYELGFSSPSAFSQYLRGNIALNIKQLLNFADYFDVNPHEIFPKLAETIGNYRYKLNEGSSHLSLVADNQTPYPPGVNEKLMTRAHEFLFDVIGIEVAKERGPHWTAVRISKLTDLFADPASENLNKETILRLIM